MNHQPDQDIQNRIALEKNNLALQRNLLALERTFSAWIRTGLASLVAGLGIANLLDISGKLWIARVTGLLLVALGGGIFLIAAWRYGMAARQLKKDAMAVLPLWITGILISILLTITVLSLFL